MWRTCADVAHAAAAAPGFWQPTKWLISNFSNWYQLCKLTFCPFKRDQRRTDEKKAPAAAMVVQCIISREKCGVVFSNWNKNWTRLYNQNKPKKKETSVLGPLFATFGLLFFSSSLIQLFVVLFQQVTPQVFAFIGRVTSPMTTTHVRSLVGGLVWLCLTIS